jgi:hypothetical protein
MYSDTLSYVKRVGWLAVFAVGVPVIGIGIPLLWLWVASQFQHDLTGIDLIPVLLLSLGIVSTYVVVTAVANWLGPPAPPAYRQQPRSRWLEPMAPDRSRFTGSTRVETFFIVTTLVVAVGADIFLVFFGHPGVPATP